MKRFAAALLAISLVLGLSACSSPAPELQEFTDGVHERDEVYPAHIETKSVALGGLGIHFSTSAFDETASRMRSLRIWRLTRGRTSSRWRPSISRRTSRTRRPSPWRPTAPSPWRPMSSARPGRTPCAEYLPGWLKSLGLEAETDGLQTLMELDWTQNVYYPAEFTRSVFTFRPVPTEWMTDADAASAYVLRLCTGLDWLLDYLETNAPESWARIEQTRPYEVRFEENIDASCTDVYSAVVHLRAPSAGLHELAHALTIDEPCGEAGWVFEGVAMHCTEWWISYEDYGIFFDLMENIDTVEGASEDERFIFGEIRRIFKELSGVDASEAQTLESPAIPLVKAMTYAMLLHPERDVFIKMVSKPTGDVMSSFYKPRYPSTELSHAKSYAFCEYLLEHGYLTFDQLAAASLDLEGYRAAFPTDEYFDELYAGYLDWLREEFGS